MAYMPKTIEVKITDLPQVREALQEVDARIAGLEAEIDQARIEARSWERLAMMGCENPPDDCGCPGCSLAHEDYTTNPEPL